MVLALNFLGAFGMLGIHFGLTEFWCGLPQNDLCTNNGADCCANANGDDWRDPEYATCTRGYEPTTQPGSYADCPNYKCVAMGASKTDRLGAPLVAEADSNHCLGTAVLAVIGYLINATVAVWGVLSIRSFNGPKIKSFGVTWGVLSMIGGAVALLSGEQLFAVAISVGLNLWLAHAAVSLGKQVTEGAITPQDPTGFSQTARALPVQAAAVPVLAQAVVIPAQVVAVQAVQPEIPVAAVTKVNP